jgi:hypothetical protein
MPRCASGGRAGFFPEPEESMALCARPNFAVKIPAAGSMGRKSCVRKKPLAAAPPRQEAVQPAKISGNLLSNRIFRQPRPLGMLHAAKDF